MCVIVVGHIVIDGKHKPLLSARYGQLPDKPVSYTHLDVYKRQGREEEIYQCEDCSGCPYAEKCKKGEGNRTVRVNQELTKMHQEVIQNLESIQGALLRMNRSIQAEGTFGIIKNDRWYKRIVRRGIKSVQLEVYLVSLGHNLYKFHNKQMKIKSAA